MSILATWTVAAIRRAGFPRSIAQGQSTSLASASSVPAATYNPNRICENSFDGDLDYSNKNIRYFDIELREGCFGSLITPPRAWHDTWHTQPISQTTGWWFAIWPAGQQPLGPLPANDNSKTHIVGPFRLQGRGTIRFFTNVDLPGEATGNDGQQSPPAKLPTLSHLTIMPGDPHICDKPDDAYYADMLGTYFPNHVPGANALNPQLLFDTSHSDDTINWANGFTGTVPVCFIIDDKGNVGDFHFPQSPGKELEDHITDRISHFRYKPGYLDFQVGFEHTEQFIKCQVMLNFRFQ